MAKRPLCWALEWEAAVQPCPPSSWYRLLHTPAMTQNILHQNPSQLAWSERFRFPLSKHRDQTWVPHRYRVYSSRSTKAKICRSSNPLCKTAQSGTWQKMGQKDWKSLIIGVLLWARVSRQHQKVYPQSLTNMPTQNWSGQGWHQCTCQIDEEKNTRLQTLHKELQTRRKDGSRGGGFSQKRAH